MRSVSGGCYSSYISKRDRENKMKYTTTNPDGETIEFTSKKKDVQYAVFTKIPADWWMEEIRGSWAMQLSSKPQTKGTHGPAISVPVRAI